MTLRPGAPDTGVVFRRVDLDGPQAIVPARWDHVVDTRLCTTIANPAGTRIATIEHLMAALAGSGVDNAIIEIDGPEVPVMDGSSAPFVFLVGCAGLIDQAAARRWLKVLREVRVEDGLRSAALLPADRFEVDCEIDFDSRAVARRHGSFEMGEGTFAHEIARARTFGFERDVERLRGMGLARGGSLDNAVVIGADDRVLNPEGLRYDDEFVRHKVLDAVGDLALAGGPLLGRFHGVRSGHEMNNRVLRALFADPDAFAWVSERQRPAVFGLPLPEGAVAAPL